MYQFWRFFKRGLVSDPQLVMGVAVLYLALGISSRYVSQYITGIHNFEEDHTGSYEEEMRKYFLEQSLNLRKDVLRKRKEYQQQ